MNPRQRISVEKATKEEACFICKDTNVKDETEALKRNIYEIRIENKAGQEKTLALCHKCLNTLGDIISKKEAERRYSGIY
ncbi:MAG: hypothetical protein FWG87_07910 [Defluviitaleaceae bacterium]|nr:hypothetical protein [Defluviitaleaceae bacterium]